MNYHEMIDRLQRKEEIDQGLDEIDSLSQAANVEDPNLTGGLLSFNQASLRSWDLLGAEAPQNIEIQHIADGIDMILGSIYFQRPIDQATIMQIL